MLLSDIPMDNVCVLSHDRRPAGVDRHDTRPAQVNARLQRSEMNAVDQDHTPERRSNWNFVITDTGWLWTITRPDGAEERSDKIFPTLAECADNAVLHGYGAWKQDERRRMDF